MSVRTIYTCEKCGREQETSEQFWKIGVVVQSYNSRPDSSTTFVERPRRLEVCRPCLQSFGIFCHPKPGDPAPVPEPTIEDLIVDLLARVGIVPTE